MAGFITDMGFKIGKGGYQKEYPRFTSFVRRLHALHLPRHRVLVQEGAMSLSILKHYL